MDIQNYFAQKKELYEKLQLFIDNDDIAQINFTNLMKIINKQNIQNDRNEFKLFIYLIDSIAQNHQRVPQFINKIEQILTELKENIKQTLSNLEIFNIFKENKRIILFLFQSQIITIDETIFKEIHKNTNPIVSIIQKSKPLNKPVIIRGNQVRQINNPMILLNKDLIIRSEIDIYNFEYFFYPEFKNYYSESDRKNIENEFRKIYGEFIIDEFLEKRKIGENDSYICQLIRQDSIDEFISFVNRQCISPMSKIPSSIFETNQLLIGKNPTLIEYAAFFGSIQICRYLMFNILELQSSLWIYVIHSRNAELIHLFEEKSIQPPGNKYEKCLEESVKCHHNEIAQYIYDNLIDDETKINNLETNFDENILAYSFHYYNYSFFPNEFNNKFIFFYSCQYNYINLVKLFLKSTKVDLNQSVIPNKKIFFLDNS